MFPVSLALFILVPITAPIVGIFVVQSNPCRLEGQSSTDLSVCSCLPDDNALLIDCQSARLRRIPALPSGTPVALSIKGDHLHSIPPDAFGGAELTLLELSHSFLQSVSANAFRGQEETLKSLKLSFNKLGELPVWAFGYMSQLETLDLSANRIRIIRNKAFDETTLTSLRFVYLQDNEIELVPTQSLRKLRALVLSLAGNRIATVEKLSLPHSLTILDLTGNLLNEIPYLALAEQPDLREVNLEGNRIIKTDFHPEVMLSNEIKLVLRNNRITALTEDSFKSFRKFSALDLSYNEISFVSPHIFETVSSVKELNMAHNRIAAVGRNTFENIGKSLEKLSMAWNNMHAVPEGLADLRVLKELNLEGNKLSKINDLPMMSFKETLTELSLAYNHLSVVPEDLLSSLSSLKTLDLSKNRIETVSAQWRIGHLTKLLLAANRITVIEQTTFFAHSPALAYLDLSFNSIERLGMSAFRTLLGLDTLFLQHNKLRTIPREALVSQTALHTFVLEANEIDALPAQATAPWPRLSRLSLRNNRIFHMDERAFSSAFSLKYLDLSKNRLTTLRGHSFELLRLSTLVLSNNRLQTLHAMCIAHINEMRRIDMSHNLLRLIPARTIYNVTSVDRLLMSNNELEHIESDAFYEVRRIGRFDISHNKLKLFTCTIFTALPRIEELNLSWNQISSLDLSCVKSSAMHLDLSHNQLQTVDEDLFEGSHSLRFLSLSHNALLSVHANALSSVPTLQHLDFSHNHLRILRRGTFAKQRSIEVLDLSHNALVSIHTEVLGNNNVHELKLAGNQLASIPIEGLRSISGSLEALDLAENYITSIDAIQFTALTNLRRLSLARNRLHSLEEETFGNLPRLEYLDLSENPFSSWHPQAFKGLSDGILAVNLARTGLFSIPRLDGPELELLDLSGNNIRDIDAGHLDAVPRLRSLNLSRNSLSTLSDRAFSNVSSLIDLHLSGNPLHALTDQHLADLSRLRSLYLNDMSSLYALPNAGAFALLTSMQNLEMTDLPRGIVNYNVSAILAALPPLQRIAVQINDPILANQLKTADTRVLRSLKVTGSILQMIDADAFRHLRGFDFDLSITGTNITEFPAAIFDTLTAIQRFSLNLSSNQLSTLRPFSHSQSPLLNRHATILHNVVLEENPLNCDCHLLWLTEWLQPGQECYEELAAIAAAAVNQPGGEPFTCSTPLPVPSLTSVTVLLVSLVALWL